MRTIFLWAMLFVAWAAQADEGLYGQWRGTTLATEFEPETTVALSLWDPDQFDLIMRADIPPEQMAFFWQDFGVEGPHVERIVVDINGVFKAQGDSLIFEIYDYYMHLETEEGTVDLFDWLIQATIQAMTIEAQAEGVGDDELALIEELVPPLVGLMRLSMIEGFSSELSGPYTREEDTLYLWAEAAADTLTLYRQGSAPTGVQQVSWGQLKSQSKP
ncbi:MAG: hypothetical protein OXE49_02150 [Gemmatimonadetes bacterium]|nr:hypothetical protein [Gemmatimonadota bacterium]